MCQQLKLLTVLTLGFVLGLCTPISAEWLESGIPLCTETGDQITPRVVTDGAGGAIIAWKDYRNEDWDIYAQRIDYQGKKLWRENDVPICLESGTQSDLHMASDGFGGAILSWADRRVEWDIFANRVDADGNIRWRFDGIPVCMAPDEQIGIKMIPDASGGAICVWMDDRHGWNNNRSVYAQKLEVTDVAIWRTDGIPICTAPHRVWVPDLATDGTGGAIITWNDARHGNLDIYAQRVDSSGNAKWEQDDKPVCRDTTDKYRPVPISDGEGGTIITWWSGARGERKVYVQRIDANGDLNWTETGVAVCQADGDQYFGEPVSDGAGGAFIVWHDNRQGNFDIYAQRVGADGNLLWKATGVAACLAQGDQKYPEPVSDGSGGIIIIWSDARSGDTDNFDIYAQNIDADGVTRWATDGVAVCNAPGDQVSADVHSDGAGGVMVAWEDFRAGQDSDIYVTRIDHDGKTGGVSEQ